MRDNYFSHVLVRCYELKNKQEETCKYILNKVLSRRKNKSENDMIRDVVFSILGSRDKWLTLLPWFQDQPDPNYLMNNTEKFTMYSIMDEGLDLPKFSDSKILSQTFMARNQDLALSAAS